MSTGRFRFSIAQPVRKNHPRPRLSAWPWLAGAGSRRLRAAAAPLLQSGYIMAYYANTLCPPRVLLAPVAAGALAFGAGCACLQCFTGWLSRLTNSPPTACRASPGIGADSRCCRFLLRLNTAAISREPYKHTREQAIMLSVIACKRTLTTFQ